MIITQSRKFLFRIFGISDGNYIAHSTNTTREVEAGLGLFLRSFHLHGQARQLMHIASQGGSIIEDCA
ncbi:hypothetical protein WAI453_011789 [Rhynchosporium graminicola]